jgi:predicted secreted protein
MRPLSYYSLAQWPHSMKGNLNDLHWVYGSTDRGAELWRETGENNMAAKIVTSKLFRPRVLSTFCTKYTGFKHYTGIFYQSTATTTEVAQNKGLTLSDSCVKVCVFD